MGWQPWRVPKGTMLVLVVAAIMMVSAGCFREGVQESVRLQARADEALIIGVDGEGWYVALGDKKKATHVTQQVIVETTASRQLMVWHNDDDRPHEIMFHRDHSDHDAIHFNPGERVERWVELDFERHIHSHFAAELPELHVRITKTGP